MRPPAQARQRRHARVVQDAADVTLQYELGQNALGENRIGQVEAPELILVEPRRHGRLSRNQS